MSIEAGLGTRQVVWMCSGWSLDKCGCDLRLKIDVWLMGIKYLRTDTDGLDERRLPVRCGSSN